MWRVVSLVVLVGFQNLLRRLQDVAAHIEVSPWEKNLYRKEEELKNNLNQKNKIILQLRKETETLIEENKELKAKVRKQGQKIIEQQREIHEQQESLREKTAQMTDLKEKKREAEAALSSQARTSELADLLEKGWLIYIDYFLFFFSVYLIFFLQLKIKYRSQNWQKRFSIKSSPERLKHSGRKMWN